MTLVKILIGLFGLGIVVFIHELGHFLAARLCKIGVEAFSIGWGRPLFKKKIKDVEYRIGVFPLGGYCKFKGEADTGVEGYKEAYELIKQGKKPEEGSYLAASPQARMLTCFAGPFFNLIFAVILFAFLSGIGSDIYTLGNKIVLASEINAGDFHPADSAGFKTGDRIIEINGKKINYSHEAQEIIMLNPNKTLNVKVERGNAIQSLLVTPELDKSTGAGRIGVYFWTDPVIGFIKEDSPASRENLYPKARVLSANGIPLANSMDLAKILNDNPDGLILEYTGGSGLGEARFTREEYKNGLGFGWEGINYRMPNLPVHLAFIEGSKNAWKTLTVSIQSFKLLFMGIDLTQAVSGPARITYMMGDIAAQGMEQGFGTALRSFMEFIALISIALFIMNLLPLPIIDGGMIILFFVEMLRKKPAHPKAIAVFQGIGIAFIAALMVFALYGDILYFIRR